MADRYMIKKLPVSVEGVPLPENLKKKMERNTKLTELKTKAISRKQKEMKKIRHDLLIRTYKYNSMYKKEEQNLIKVKREARSKGGYYRAPEPKVIFAIRIKGINKLAPKPKMILRLFRLRQLHNGIFIKINKATVEMLKAIQPFITYGYPSLRTIRQLIYKRGYGKVVENGSKQRVRLTDNRIISKHLGKYGIHGVEDMVHQIYTCGPYFKQTTNFLWPVKLSSPRKGFVCKRHGFNEPRGGDWGNREELINELVARMNTGGARK